MKNLVVTKRRGYNPRQRGVGAFAAGVLMIVKLAARLENRTYWV